MMYEFVCPILFEIKPLALLLLIPEYLSHHYFWIQISCCLDSQFSGMVEAWASGLTWRELMMDCPMDEGDLARLLRRTIDLLAQVSMILKFSELQHHIIYYGSRRYAWHQFNNTTSTLCQISNGVTYTSNYLRFITRTHTFYSQLCGPLSFWSQFSLTYFRTMTTS